MKIFKWSKNSKWYERISWIKNIIICLIVFLICIFSFGFLIDKGKNLDYAYFVSLTVSLLIFIKHCVSDVIENRINIYVEKKNKLYIIFPQKYTSDYDNCMISYDSFIKFMNDEENVYKIVDDISLFQGVSLYEVNDIRKVVVHKKYIMFVSVGNLSFWKSSRNQVLLSSKNNLKMLFRIPFDYNNYEDFTTILKKYENKDYAYLLKTSFYVIMSNTRRSRVWMKN